jgi:hypothetical protein
MRQVSAAPEVLSAVTLFLDYNGLISLLHNIVGQSTVHSLN